MGIVLQRMVVWGNELGSECVTSGLIGETEFTVNGA